MEFSELALDGLREMVHIGVGHAASVINQMISARIFLQVPELEWVEPVQFLAQIDEGAERVASVNQAFSGELEGFSAIVFPPASASILVASVLSEEQKQEEGFDELRISALSEIGNIVLNSVLGTMSNMLGYRLHYLVPTYHESFRELVAPVQVLSKGSSVLSVRVNFRITDLNVSGHFLVVLTSESLVRLAQSLHELGGES